MSTISKICRATFIIDVIACSIVGILLFIAPTVMFSDPFAGNMMGGVFISFVLLNGLALKETELEKVKYIIIIDIISNSILSIIAIIGFFVYDLPAAGWIIVGGATAFSISYILCWRNRKENEIRK